MMYFLLFLLLLAPSLWAQTRAGNLPFPRLEEMSVVDSNEVRVSYVSPTMRTWAVVRSTEGQSVPPTPPPLEVLSVGWTLWTNLIAQTNGKSPFLLSSVDYPADWTTNGPAFVRHPGCLINGMKGSTSLSLGAYSPWVGEAIRDTQGPATLVTRRHAIGCGHCAGIHLPTPDTNYAGRHMFFVTSSNTVHVRRIVARINRLVWDERCAVKTDYAVYLFDADLPDSIESVPLVPILQWQQYLAFFPYPTGLKPCQHGVVGGLLTTHNATVAGDSGHPDWLPLPEGGETQLALVWNRTSCAACCPEPLQEDIDTLSTWAGLNPAEYQLEWKDLSIYEP